MQGKKGRKSEERRPSAKEQAPNVSAEEEEPLPDPPPWLARKNALLPMRAKVVPPNYSWSPSARVSNLLWPSCQVQSNQKRKRVLLQNGGATCCPPTRSRVLQDL